jgi:hypothetical protein
LNDTRSALHIVPRFPPAIESIIHTRAFVDIQVEGIKIELFAFRVEQTTEFSLWIAFVTPRKDTEDLQIS